jgi:hypothetical protein
MFNFQLPFSGPLGTMSGPSEDGCLYSKLPRLPTPVAITQAAVSEGDMIYVGDAATDGSIAFFDRTMAAASATADDVSFFDGDDPTRDTLCLALVPGDILSSIDFLVTTPGVYTGVASARVSYKQVSGGWTDVVVTATPDFRTVGLKRLIFNPIDIANVALLSDMIDPRNQPDMRCVLITFGGISNVTTPPRFSRIFKRRAPGVPKVVSAFTNLLNAAVTTDFTPYLSVTALPLAGDTTLLGYAGPWTQMRVKLTRPRFNGWPLKMIYSKADGTFGTMLPAEIDMNSGTVGQPWTSTTTGVWLSDKITPPTDWGPTTIVDKLGVSSTMYWWGWEYLADATMPQPLLLASFDAQPFSSPGTTGVRAVGSGAISLFEIYARATSPSESRFLIANSRSGVSLVVVVPANAERAEVPIAMTIEDGDEIIVQQIAGDNLVQLADGFIRLSGA